MDIPKPRPTQLRTIEAEQRAATATQTVVEQKPQSKLPKPVFVRKPHLTDRPLKNHLGLLELHKELSAMKPPATNSRKNKKRR